MVREAAVDLSRVYYPGGRPDPSLQVNAKRRRNLWRTSPKRRNAGDADGHRDLTAAPVCGRCLAMSRSTNLRCKRRTCLDYRYCPQHLSSIEHLAIAPSRRLRDLGVPHKAVGLYAVAPNQRLLKDREGFPLISAAAPVVFSRGKDITPYGGEVLSPATFAERYGDPGDRDTAAYALGMTGRRVVDGLSAATAATYSNEALDMAPLMRHARNYAEFAKIYNAAERTDANQRLINVDSHQSQNVVYLRATRAIHHGEEILWNYSHVYWGSESLRRYLIGKGW